MACCYKVDSFNSNLLELSGDSFLVSYPVKCTEEHTEAQVRKYSDGYVSYSKSVEDALHAMDVSYNTVIPQGVKL